MTDEITTRVGISVTGANGFTYNQNFTAVLDQAGTASAFTDVLSVTTSEADVTITGLTTPGQVILKNLDATNFVKYGPKDTTMTDFAKIPPGGSALFHLLDAVVVLRMVADTATCAVQIEVQEA